VVHPLGRFMHSRSFSQPGVLLITPDHAVLTGSLLILLAVSAVRMLHLWLRHSLTIPHYTFINTLAMGAQLSTLA